jgi:hypothetical protein
MTAILVTWNPNGGPGGADFMVREHDICVEASDIRAEGGDMVVRFSWDTGNRHRDLEAGVVLYVLQVGEHIPPAWRGIVRVGTMLDRDQVRAALGREPSWPGEGPVFWDPNWNPSARKPRRKYVYVEWGDALPQDNPLPKAALKRANLRWWNGNPVNWDEGGIQTSGYMFDATSEARLKGMWSRQMQRRAGWSPGGE